MTSSLHELLKVIQEEAEAIAARRVPQGVTLEGIFSEVIGQTMKEIKAGANSDDFADLVVINLLIRAGQEGFHATEVQGFVQTLVSDLEDEGEEA